MSQHPPQRHERLLEGAHILVVEDEESMLAGLEYALEREGCRVELARDGAAALEALRRGAPDLLLLDLMLPKRSGFEVLAQLRRAGRSTPVIVLSARNQEADKLKGFDLGADDFVTKPFSLAELLARMRVRLAHRARARLERPERIELGSRVCDLVALVVHSTSAPEREVELSVREAQMLALLWSERGRPVSRERFLDEVWGRAGQAAGTRTVDQHIAQLRKKIEDQPGSPRHLRTVFGAGYRLDP